MLDEDDKVGKKVDKGVLGVAVVVVHVLNVLNDYLLSNLCFCDQV